MCKWFFIDLNIIYIIDYHISIFYNLVLSLIYTIYLKVNMFYNIILVVYKSIIYYDNSYNINI